MVDILSLIGILDLKALAIPEKNSDILSSNGAEVSVAFITITEAGNLCFTILIASILEDAFINSSRFCPLSISVTLKYFIITSLPYKFLLLLFHLRVLYLHHLQTY